MPIYKEFNGHNSSLIDKNLFIKQDIMTKKIINYDSNPKKKPSSKNLIYNPNKEEEKNCKRIFELFRKVLEETSSEKLPKQPVFYENEPKVKKENIDKISFFFDFYDKRY